MRRVCWILLVIVAGGCLDDPKPKQVIGSCVGGIGGRSIVNTGKVGGIVLNTTGAGTWRSEAFALGGPTSLAKIFWDPRAPYGRQLGDDPPFDEGGVMLTNNVFLAHFDEPGGAPYTDSTGSLSLECQAPLICPTRSTGRFGGGISFNGNGATLGGRRLANTTLEPQFFTLEAWARVTGPNVGPDYTMMIVTKGHAPTAPYTQYSLEWDPTLGGRARCYAGLNLPGALVGSAPLPMNQWFHLACSWDGTNLRLFTNGEPDGTTQVPGGQIDYSSHFDQQELIFGRFGTMNQMPAQRMVGDIDEVAIWSQALDPDVIRDHYRRGALRLRLQLNHCDSLDSMHDCAGDFVGPDGTTSSFYEEACAPDNDNGDRVLPLTGYNCDQGNHDGGGTLNARSYLQYEAHLESDRAGISPELTDVQLCR